MTAIKQILIFACIIVSVAMISGCTMSDSDIQGYIDSHPDEVKAYVDSHGQQISSYLAEHPEILEQITFPTTTVSPEQQPPVVEDSPSESPTESQTVSLTETPLTTIETTIVPTTVEQTPTITTEIQTTQPTTEPTIEITTEPTVNVTTVVTTEIPTTIPTTEPTPVPTPTPYISTVTGQPAIVDVTNPWTLVSPQEGIRATMTVSLNYNNPSYSGVDPFNGIATISGEANNVAIKREDGNPVGVGSLHGTDFSYQFTWHDNIDGTYSTSSIINPLDWSDRTARTITYSVSGTSEKLHFSGWPEGTYLSRG